MLDIALRLYILPQLQAEYSLHRAFSQFLGRVFRLLPKEELANRALAMLQLSPSNPVLLERSVWPNIVELLRDEDISPDTGEDWHFVVDAVLDQVASSHLPDDTAASYHFARLDWFYRHGLMTRAQVSRFAFLIWQDAQALPSIPGFYRGAVLMWPAPTNKVVKDAFRDWLRKESIERIVTASDVSGESRPTISSVRESFLANVLLSGNKGVAFLWSRSDLLTVVDKLEKWWRDEGPYLNASQ